MSAAIFSFDEDQFNRLFPFYLLIDADESINKCGKSLAKLFAVTQRNKKFNESFAIRRPELNNPSFQVLKELANQLIVIEPKQEHKINLKGQFEYLQKTNQLLFIGSPWFDTVEEVTTANLSLNDFAIHDPLMDLLHVL